MKNVNTSFTYDVLYNPKNCTQVVTFIRKFGGDLCEKFGTETTWDPKSTSRWRLSGLGWWPGSIPGGPYHLLVYVGLLLHMGWDKLLRQVKSVLSNLFQAMGHFKKFHVVEGRIDRLLQSNPGRCPGTAASSLGRRSIGPDHNALLQHSGPDLEVFRLFSRTGRGVSNLHSFIVRGPLTNQRGCDQTRSWNRGGQNFKG